MYKFSKKSQEKLNTCDEKLQLIMNELIKIMDVTIICGSRGKKEQDEAVASGASKVKFPNSKHNKLPKSKAVDTVPYPIDWNNKERFYYMGGIVKGMASVLGIKIKWGGDFKNFFDGPHFELED